MTDNFQLIQVKFFANLSSFSIKQTFDLQFVKTDQTIEPALKKQQPPETTLQRFERLTGINPCLCPVCKTGRMVVIKQLPRIRLPDGSLQYQQSSAALAYNKKTHFIDVPGRVCPYVE